MSDITLSEQPSVPAVRPPPPAPDQGAAINVFASASNFNVAQRMAQALSSADMVPASYKANLANCMIAIELASRIGASVFAVMQNLDIIHGRPAWRSTFLIASVNASGKFTPLRFRYFREDGTELPAATGERQHGCRCVARDKITGEECVGSLITLAMANAEGWSTKNGSKWKTMPEQMLMYRAAAFWTRVFAPELSLGMHTGDELRDVHGSTGVELLTTMTPGSAKELEAKLLGAKPDVPVVEPVEEDA